MHRSIESLESASVGLKSLGSLLSQTLELMSSLVELLLAMYSAYSLLRMSLAHSRLVVMVVYLCFLTRLLAVVLLPLAEELLEVELLLVEVQLPQELPVVALEVVLVQVQ
jgi:ABC-type glycerol-3-phosphate transport system permease component